MRTYSAIRHFGTQAKLARALGITQQSIQYWGVAPPPLRQLQIERITEGKLKADKRILDVPQAEVAA